jgi:competence protein ComEC
MTKIIKRHFFLLVCILSSIGFFLWNERPYTHPTIVFCDVGQGDAVLVIDQSRQLLIDGGPDASVLSCLGRHMPFWDRTIEFVVATHPDSDHITGLLEVLKRFKTPLLMIEWSDKRTAEFEAFKRLSSSKALKNETSLLEPKPGMVVTFGEQLWGTVHWPPATAQDVFTSRSGLPGKAGITRQADNGVNSEQLGETTETQLWDDTREIKPVSGSAINYNNRSIVLLLHIYSTRVLLTGDLEYQGEQALLATGMTERANILKAGHHGSKTSSSRGFLDAVKPETVVISAGKNNRYGHPSSEVLARLDEYRTRVFSTVQSGDVVISFLENGYVVEKEFFQTKLVER